ncbi:hypothetical protein IOD16_10005 [Saccharothrix sp. 6-C]|uniref:hypothetical protein n=1 Tax=Saccharothrix sp. 6-C TaxID=2781735 RepID=UPI001917948C|nr:hypothetical protein [Saccharothrix sp. 6-C]QQQ78743.1 hypothetical protein IOD16_10005 [Saccharothrix sp. 6-C]
MGTDYAGKSAVMRELARHEPGWRLVSVDDQFLAPEHDAMRGLKSVLFNETLPGLGKHHSADVVASLLQTAVVHLRDQLPTGGSGDPVVVDSYYYKILAKCRLIDADPAVFGWWRGFPQPSRALFLDVDPMTAWERSSRGAAANQLEFHGEHVDRDAFALFQTDLRALLEEESGHLPVEHLPESDLDATVTRVREAVRREFA